MHLTGQQIKDYRRRALPPRELLEVDDHLADCPECRLRVAEGEPLSGAFAAWEALPEAPEPTAVRLDRRARPWRPAFLAAALLLLTCGVFWIAKPPGIEEPASDGPILRGREPAAAPGFTLLAPLSTEVPGGRPDFRWTPLAGAESYRVTVFDRDFNKVADSGPLSRTDWTPDRPLPGGTYTWQVKARRDGAEITAPGPSLPQAFFQVIQFPSPISTNPAQ